MKFRFLTIASLFLWAVSAWSEGRAKYVFYFIGDGMGVNQVNAAETYLGAVEGRIGITPLCFPSFPHSAMINTQSATNGVTDSAAGGTALACGKKTQNGTLGMLKDRQTPVYSVAEWAHRAGAAVGVTTSVSIDHATPAAFYAHVGDRGESYKIGKQLTTSGYDFFAGSDFVKPQEGNGEKDLYQQAQDQGYTIVKSFKEYQKKSNKADKVILFQSDEANKRDRTAIPYALDRGKDDLSLSDITRAAIHFLTQKQSSKDGFFLMVEGGKIDWACHANDPSFIPELIDMDNAVKVAYEFYLQHPDETLIVVTADHETGGLVLGRGSYNLYLDRLAYQRMTISKLGKELHALHDKLGDRYNWESVKNFLSENFGLWTKIELSDEQTTRLKKSFDRVMEGKSQDSSSLYQKDDELASNVKQILSECARLSWASGGHSNGYVPCFAIGVGAEGIHGRMDNTEIPLVISKAAGWPIIE